MRLSPLDPELYRMQAGMAAGRLDITSAWAEKAFQRPQDLATFADGLRKAGLPE
jgi:hypothetical protein